MDRPRRTVGIVGASGFIGSELAAAASLAGWRVVGFSRSERNPGGAIGEWRQWRDVPDLKGLDAVVNLAGEPVDQRWTSAVRERLRQSRVGVTRAILRGMDEHRPGILVNGSAVGIYGDRGEEPLNEKAEPGEGFLAELCREWESAADEAPEEVRVAKMRIGIVLGSGGAAWEKMRKVFGFGLGGRFAGGRQWMPWVHVADLAGGIVHTLENDDLSGPVNGAAPGSERNADFTRKLSTALNRPAFFHAPEWALRVGLGEFADALLASQRVMPEALLQSGYNFRFPALPEALQDLL